MNYTRSHNQGSWTSWLCISILTVTQEGPSTSPNGKCLGGNKELLGSAVPTYRKWKRVVETGGRRENHREISPFKTATLDRKWKNVISDVMFSKRSFWSLCGNSEHRYKFAILVLVCCSITGKTKKCFANLRLFLPWKWKRKSRKRNIVPTGKFLHGI